MTEDQVWSLLRGIKSPLQAADLVETGTVSALSVQGSDIKVTVKLRSPSRVLRQQLDEAIRREVRPAPQGGKLHIEYVPEYVSSCGNVARSILPGVKNIVPVASGKGGVGKSTVSLNLALALSDLGARVGLFDADVYGPSIPGMMGLKSKPVAGERGLIPVEYGGLKVISAGFFLPEEGAAVLRGPMLHNLIRQFLTEVDWGELDYLVIDLPPGTGDIQLTLSQMIPFMGALVVTTPQRAAGDIAKKAVWMFQKLNTPILGLVENMGHWICGSCGESEAIFGEGGGKALAEALKLNYLGSLPLSRLMRKLGDEGNLLFRDHSGSAEAESYRNLADRVSDILAAWGLKHESAPVKITLE